MKKPEEIKKGLGICSENADCNQCPYMESSCIDALLLNALAYIQQLEASLAQAERDAKEMADNLDCSACNWCEYLDPDYANEACKECRTYNEGFKLRGPCLENMKEDKPHDP